MRALITGGLGVVGSLLSKHLLENSNNSVVIIDAAEEPRNLWTALNLFQAFGKRVTIHQHRLENFEDISKILKEVDQVIHAAAHTGIEHSSITPNDDWISNVDATRYLLEEMRKLNREIPTVVLSSVKPYKTNQFKYHKNGNKYVWNDIIGIDESCPLEPDEPYAASKMAQSALSYCYAHSYGLPITTIRFSNLYGPAPCHGPRHGWLTWFCIAAATNKAIEIQGSGFQTRDMLYSDDIITAINLVLKHISTTAGKIYNVGGGLENAISVDEAINYISGKTVFNVVKGLPKRKNEDNIFITDYSKFNKDTEWLPKVNVYQGIDYVFQWAENNAERLEMLYNGVK